MENYHLKYYYEKSASHMIILLSEINSKLERVTLKTKIFVCI